MAEGQSMTVADVVARTMDGRLEDFVREAVALVARELMEGEISAEIGAGLGEVAPETRLTHRNGYRPRAWETRAGEIELLGLLSRPSACDTSSATSSGPCVAAHTSALSPSRRTTAAGGSIGACARWAT